MYVGQKELASHIPYKLEVPCNAYCETANISSTKAWPNTQLFSNQEVDGAQQPIRQVLSLQCGGLSFPQRQLVYGPILHHMDTCAWLNMEGSNINYSCIIRILVLFWVKTWAIWN